MAVFVPQLLQPGVVNKTISQLKVKNNRLQNFFGGGEDGSRITRTDGRNFSWDIYNESRKVSNQRAPATGPSKVAPNPVGNVVGVFPRVHESIPLEYERIHNQRVVGGPLNNIDVAGRDYIRKQERYLKQRLTNYREFQHAAMLRGGWYYKQQGDDLLVSLEDNGGVYINYHIPAGNKSQLNMLGDGDIISTDWDDPDADIPSQCERISAAMEALNGWMIRHCWIGVEVMGYLFKNNSMKGRAGTAHPPMKQYNALESNDYEVVFEAIPWLTFHVTSGVLEMSSGLVRIIPQKHAIFMPDVDDTWYEYGAGSEIVIEWIGQSPTPRYDAYYWAVPTAQPAGYELVAVQNGLPYLYVPTVIADATVVTP